MSARASAEGPEEPAGPEALVDYEALGFTPEEERLLREGKKLGSQARWGPVLYIMFNSGLIVGALVYGFAHDAWEAFAAALFLIGVNTLRAAVQAWRSPPVWRGAILKLEALLRELAQRRARDASDP